MLRVVVSAPRGNALHAVRRGDEQLLRSLNAWRGRRRQGRSYRSTFYTARESSRSSRPACARRCPRATWQTCAAVAGLTLLKLAEFYTSAILLRQVSAYELKAWLSLNVLFSFLVDLARGEAVFFPAFALCAAVMLIGILLIARDGGARKTLPRHRDRRGRDLRIPQSVRSEVERGISGKGARRAARSRPRRRGLRGRLSLAVLRYPRERRVVGRVPAHHEQQGRVRRIPPPKTLRRSREKNIQLNIKKRGVGGG